MGDTVKKQFVLEGLHCANCAAKIENNIKQLNYVNDTNLNFQTSIVDIYMENENNKIQKDIQEIVKRIEPSVKVKKVMKNERNEKSTVDYIMGQKSKLIKIIGALILFILSLFIKNKDVKLTFYIIAYIVAGGDVILTAIRNIAHGEVFDENFLMAVATMGAFFIKEYPEAVAVMVFYQIGELFQDAAVMNSRKSIANLMDIKADWANLKEGDKIIKVNPEDVKIGQIIIVKPGEKIPLDGEVVEGQSSLNMAALTGESKPYVAKKGDKVLSGAINENSILTLKVEKKYEDSTIVKILDLVENAGSKKAPTEKFITKFARYYTPIVVFSALFIAVIPPIITKTPFSSWINRALVFLVVSCPCALLVSIPLGFFGGIGLASKNGILVKGGNYLEALNDVDSVIFDKTGTLTKGEFEVKQIKSFKGFTDDEILKYAASCEKFSTHPIATSIIKEYTKHNNEYFDVNNYEVLNGKGIKAIVNNKNVLIGNKKILKEDRNGLYKIAENDTIVYIVIEAKLEGYISIGDNIKKDSKEAIEELKKLGIKNTVMLTGDNENTARKTSESLGINKFFAELLPQDKVEKVEELKNNIPKNKKLVFVGDGINDAPVLSMADLGVAMGGLGSDAAIEAADVVLMTDEPLKLITAIKISKKTRKIVNENIIFALAVKFTVLILATLGVANMWAAVFADVGVTLIAIFNSMRILKFKI